MSAISLNLKTLSGSILILVLTIFSLSTPVFAADPAIEAALLNPVQSRLNAAASQRLNVMVPESYDKANKYFLRAADKLKKGKTLKSVEEDLAVANAALDNLDAKTDQAKLTLKSGMAVRDDALQVKSNEINPGAWEEAEQEFRKAATILERGNVKNAEARQEKAIAAYRAIELSAIKVNYLADTSKLIKKAQADKVDRYAPKTVARAANLFNEASSALNTDRYDTDRPRSLAREANYEAAHARYLAKQARAIDDDDMSVEDLLLQSEEPYREIAGELDIIIDQSYGPDAPTKEILTAIRYLKEEIRDLGLQLSDKNQQIVTLQGKAQEGAALAQQIKAQDARRAQFARVQNMFSPEEARVMRLGDNITVSLIGLAFDSGKSELSTENAPLLEKVRQALGQYPSARLDIEGHTDSFGGDDANLILSQQRAESVRTYLLGAISSLNPVNVKAYGYGESKPVANNESKEGRARNRRIDLLIKP